MPPGPGPTYEDVNAAAIEDWVEDTTPAERVRHVMRTTYEPVSADAVAEQAQVSPKTARKHLNALANQGYLTTTPGDRGGTYYRRSEESLLLEQASDILQNSTRTELQNRVAEMGRRVREFEARYGASSPETLVVEQTADVLAAEETSEHITHDDLVEWSTIRRNLAFANVALSLATAKDAIQDTAHASTSSSVEQ